MPTTGIEKPDREKYLESWTQMMITIWQEKMMKYRINDTGALYDSLRAHIEKSTGGDVAKIEHFFNFYGIYVDRGTGREFSRDNGGDLGFTPTRESRPWFNPQFYYFTMRLAEKMAEFSGEEYVYIIKKVIEGTK